MFSEERNLQALSLDESLINTEEFCILVKPLLKNMKDADEFAESLYICMPELQEIYDEQVITMPDEWKIPKHYSDALKENLFHKDWLNETKSQFLSFIKSSLKLKWKRIIP